MTAGIASPEKDGQFAPKKRENFELLIGKWEYGSLKKTHSN
jgi:hypothetical protein